MLDQAQDDVEAMCTEVVRILKTVYDPTAGTGAFFTARYNWLNSDNFNSQKPELIRTLHFVLTEIQSDSTEVFRGYGGVLVLDTSATTADSKPVSDYTYTEAYNVQMTQGYEVIPEIIQSGTSAVGVPVYFRGEFMGDFTCETFAKKSDINTSTIEALDNIYKAQNDNELAEIVFLHSVDNTEGTPITFTDSIPLLVTRIEKNTEDEELVRFTIKARISDPSTYTVA